MGEEGIEPSRLLSEAQDFKSCASASFATRPAMLPRIMVEEAVSIKTFGLQLQRS